MFKIIYYILGRSKSKKKKRSKQKSNKVDKSRKKNIGPLLEDISSDDNFAMESEEEGALVFSIFVFNFHVSYYDCILGL